MKKVTFQNKSNNDVRILFADSEIIVPSGESESLKVNADCLHFVAYRYLEKPKPVERALGFLFLSLIQFIISFLLEEMSLTTLDKYLYLAVNADVKNIAEGAVITFKDSPVKMEPFTIEAVNAELFSQWHYDENDIQSQLKSYRFEVSSQVWLLCGILLFIAGYCIYIKNVVTVIVGIVILLLMLYAWYYNHKKNVKLLHSIIQRFQKE